MAKYDVFISFKNTHGSKITPDAKMAQELFDELKRNNVSAFFSKASILEQGDGDYRSQIDNALDDCKILVVVGTSVEYLNSKWVRYEYVSFHEDLLNGRKDPSECSLFSYISGIENCDLPRPLRNLQFFENLEDVVSFILNRLNLNSKPYLKAEDNPQNVQMHGGAKIKEKIVSKKKTENKKGKARKNDEGKKRTHKKLIAISGVALVLLVCIVLISSFANRLSIPVIENGQSIEISAKKDDSYLYLKDCEITSETVQAVCKMDNLSSLSLTDCSFNEDSYKQLSAVSSLKSLSFENCSSISDLSFLSGMSISELTLKNCSLNDSMLKKEYFPVTLTGIDVSYNSDLTDVSFLKDLNLLRSVNFDSTSVSNIDVFEGFEKLIYIDFNDCFVEDISSLKSCSQLFSISANNNSISDISPLSELTRLNTISFENNKIESITDVFKSLEIEAIDISGNKLVSVSGFTDLTIVSDLDLSNNMLGENPDVLDFIEKSCKTLKYCNLNSNDLPAAAFSVLSDATALITLNISNNPVEDISFLNCSDSLVSLNASDCNLKDIGVLKGYSQLENIYLNNNQIRDASCLRTVSSEFYVTIDLSYNNLTEISQVVSGNVKYSKILLYGNQITDFSSLSNIECNALGVTYNEGITAQTFSGFQTPIYISSVPNDKRVSFNNELSYLCHFGTIGTDGEFTEE